MHEAQLPRAKRAVRPDGRSTAWGRPHDYFSKSPCRLTRQDTGLSSRRCGCESRRGDHFVRTSAGCVPETRVRRAPSDFSEACRQPEPAGANFCARGVEATQRSASPQSRVRLAHSSDECGLCPTASPLPISASLRLGARTISRSCGVTAAQRTFNPHSAGANPAGSTNLPPVSHRGRTCGEVFRCRATWNCWQNFSRVGRGAIHRSAKPTHAGASPARASSFRGCGANSSTPRPQRGGDGA